MARIIASSKKLEFFELSAVDSGKIILIGATTENPTYYLNDALVSRLFILRLKRLSITATQKLIQKALSQDEVLAKHKFKIDDSLYNAIHNYSEGDCRKILNLLERMFLISARDDEIYLNKELFDQTLGEASRDFHLWLSVMLDNGVDPLVIARRIYILPLKILVMPIRKR